MLSLAQQYRISSIWAFTLWKLNKLSSLTDRTVTTTMTRTTMTTEKKEKTFERKCIHRMGKKENRAKTYSIGKLIRNAFYN